MPEIKAEIKADTQYDLIVIGGGPGGYVAAIRAAQNGMKVACVEKTKTLGGTCLNVGCIPSKALLDSSEHYYFAKTKFAKHGILIDNPKLDLGAMMKRKDQVVSGLTTGIDGLFKKNKIERFVGVGSLQKPANGLHVVEVKGPEGAQKISAKNVLLATGSIPAELPVAKFDGKRVISSTEALSLAEVPKHLVVIGGGVIGLELGSVWARLGAKVTVVEFLDKLLPTCDSALAMQLHRILQKQGLEFKLGTKCLGTELKGSQVVVKLDEQGKTSSLECDYVLVCAGRKPFTDGLGLDVVGVQKDDKGRVIVDDKFQSNVPGIFAIGDLIEGPMLAHKAEDEGVAVVDGMKGLPVHVNYATIPSVVYTWPELASVGYTEDELKSAGVAYKIGTFPFAANGRAKAMDEVEGSVKILADARNDRVLGVHVLGARAADMIAEAVAVMDFGGTAEELARICHAHPTLSEIMKEAALAVNKRQIHM